MTVDSQIEQALGALPGLRIRTEPPPGKVTNPGKPVWWVSF